MLRLATEFTMDLLNRPESGMGYQVVEVTSFDNRTASGIVYNADLLLFEGEPREKLKTETYSRMVDAAESSSGRIKAIRVVGRNRGVRSTVLGESSAYPSRPGPAKNAPKEQSAPGDAFKRFSAYRNDRRVQSDRSLLPGTYATTEADARNVKTGSDAVRRYALPDPEPASNVFTIRPHGGTTMQRGIVEPAYNQPGGGVEVLFADGTQAGTVSGPVRIPD
jgi:hypothetical protein